MIAAKGSQTTVLAEPDVAELLEQSVNELPVRDRRVLVIIPDNTRTAPMRMLFRHLVRVLRPAARRLDFIIALGTHPPMSSERINAMLGLDAVLRDDRYHDVHVYNHRWDLPGQLHRLGTVPAERVAELSEGRLCEPMPVRINRRALDYDLLLICGPVFPHEVVGFSGGHKYLFPGISAGEVIDFSHWLGALITNPRINGNKYTPVRALIDQAAAMVPADKRLIALVVHHDGLHGMYVGDCVEAWSAAADLSAGLHIVHRDRPYQRVLARAQPMYDDIWTAGKCMYKLEPVVADGGELIIYAPHVREISYTHGRILDAVGYHIRDYFVTQWDRFRSYPWGVLAHSTHVPGIGRFHDDSEQPRVQVTLATRIPEQRCRAVNLGYLDPRSIRIEDFADREDDGILYIPHAGENLFRLTDPPEWQRP